MLATLIDDTLDHWKEAQVLYTYPEEHTVSGVKGGSHRTTSLSPSLSSCCSRPSPRRRLTRAGGTEASSP